MSSKVDILKIDFPSSQKYTNNLAPRIPTRYLQDTYIGEKRLVFSLLYMNVDNQKLGKSYRVFQLYKELEVFLLVGIILSGNCKTRLFFLLPCKYR